MKVVTSAISTIIANSAGEITPEVETDVEHHQLHQPAGVHQHADAPRQSRHDIPPARAASAEPPSLPTTATSDDQRAVDPQVRR